MTIREQSLHSVSFYKKQLDFLTSPFLSLFHKFLQFLFLNISPIWYSCFLFFSLIFQQCYFMKKRTKCKCNRWSTRNFFPFATENYMIFYFKKHFSKKYLTLNGFQRNVFLRFLKLTSLRFLGFSKSTGVSYRGVSYNRILSV